MEMYQIRYFLAIHEMRSFKGAAQQCNVSQPSLSRAIKLLEEELGGPVFRRGRSDVALTDLGARVLPYFQQIVGAASAAKVISQWPQGPRRAKVNVGVMCTIAPQRLVSLVRHIGNSYPEIELVFHDAVPERLLKSLAKGSVDVALLAMPVEIPREFETRTLYRERFLVAFPPGHRFEQKSSVKLSDMHNEAYLERLNCEYASYIDSLLEERTVHLEVRYKSEREDWIQALILAGLGCAMVPEHLLMFPNLPSRPIVRPTLVRNVKLVRLRGRDRSPAVDTVIRLLLSRGREQLQASP